MLRPLIHSMLSYHHFINTLPIFQYQRTPAIFFAFYDHQRTEMHWSLLPIEGSYDFGVFCEQLHFFWRWAPRTKTLLLEIIPWNRNLKTADDIHLPDYDFTMGPPLPQTGECSLFVNKKKISPFTGLEWPRGFQEVMVPRFHDNGTGSW